MLLKKLLFYFMTFLILTFCAELVLRVGGYIYVKRGYDHLDKQNSLPPESINIVVLGESSTAGLWVDSNDSYPRQLIHMLREHYNNDQIHVIIPPHIGHNTSQMANRVEEYLKLYEPRLLIMMMGINNQYSWAESHVGRFLKLNSVDQLKIKGLIFFSELRLFKVIHYVYLTFIQREDSEYVRRLGHEKYVWGGPEIARFPPKKYITSLASSNNEAFVKMWKFDMEHILSTANSRGIHSILMTYHIHPDSSLPIKELVSMAHKFNVVLIRNDKEFAEKTKGHSVEDYLLHDGWHPSPKGYELIARNVFHTIVSNDLLDLSVNKR